MLSARCPMKHDCSNTNEGSLWLLKIQCLGSGSVGSARFWLSGSGSGSAKICGSTDPDLRGKISKKNCKKIFFSLRPQIWTFEKKEIIKISSFLNGSSSFRIKISEKKFENYFLLKNFIKSWRNDLFSSADPGSGSASKLNGS